MTSNCDFFNVMIINYLNFNLVQLRVAIIQNRIETERFTLQTIL